MEYQGIWFNGGKEEASKETRERVAQVGCYIPIILVTWEIEAEDVKFKASLRNLARTLSQN